MNPFNSIVDYRERTPEDAAELSLLRMTVTAVLKTLTRREQLILQLRFGLNAQGITYTVEESARLLKQKNVDGFAEWK